MLKLQHFLWDLCSTVRLVAMCHQLSGKVWGGSLIKTLSSITWCLLSLELLNLKLQHRLKKALKCHSIFLPEADKPELDPRTQMVEGERLSQLSSILHTCAYTDKVHLHLINQSDTILGLQIRSLWTINSQCWQGCNKMLIFMKMQFRRSF